MASQLGGGNNLHLCVPYETAIIPSPGATMYIQSVIDRCLD